MIITAGGTAGGVYSAAPLRYGSLLSGRVHIMRAKKAFRSVVAASVAAAGLATPAPVSAETAGCLGQSTFEEGIGFPWHICSTSPAEQQFNISGGTYNVTIVNPGGQARGGDSRWDIQFRHKDLHIEAGHKYKVHWEVTASCDGEIYTRIGSSNRNEDGVWQNNSELWGQGWSPVKIEKGNNSFDSEFTAERTAEVAEWAFEYGGAGPYQMVDCFPEGASLKFDNMYLECETCGEEYISESETPCLWSVSEKWNNDDIYGIITPRSDVRINQLGYYNNSVKKVTYATSEEKLPVSFKVLDKDGKAVYESTGEKIGFDEDCGEYCQILDFSEVNETGTYTIVVDDEENVYTDSLNGKTYKKYISPEFRIGGDIYEGVLTDALNYYYQDRSGKDIEEKYITSGDKAKLAHRGGHSPDMAYVQSRWQRSYGNKFDGDAKVRIDATGGWYDPETHCKNVVNGANAVWLMQNMYERSVAKGTDGKWNDGETMKLPENSSDSGYPDILEEARYELEFMFRMIVDPEKDSIWGEECADLVYHDVRDSKYIGLAVSPYDYEKIYRTTRIVDPPTYAATFGMIACAAQASRLWKGIDDVFAAKCLETAEKSWEAVYNKLSEWHGRNGDWSKNSQFAPNMYYVGTNSWDNIVVDDEAYWAACELFSATGKDSYYDYLKDYKTDSGDDHNKAFDVTVAIGVNYGGYSFSSFNNADTAALGTLSLYLSDKISAEDRKTIKNRIEQAAKEYTDRENYSENSMGVPYKPVPYIEDLSGLPSKSINGYEYASNGFVVNNAVIMAYAYDITGNSGYLNGVSKAMDYIFGRNGLGISYVTGYGSRHINNPCHRYWINESDRSYPVAPSGVMVGGAASGLVDAYVGGLGMRRGETAPQKCYVDSVEAWFENTPSLEMQAALAWDISFLEDEAGGETATTTTTTTDITITTTTTTTDYLHEPIKYGDANCDGDIDMGDAVLIMQSLANPNKFGIGGTDSNALRTQGADNADVDNRGNGLTTSDALRIQEYLLGKIKTFVE